MNDISNFLDHQQCPGVDGIVFPTGEIQIVNVAMDRTSPASLRLKPGAKTSINELKLRHQLFWSDCAILERIVDEKEQIEVVAGESDYGSDGFVAVLSNPSKKLKWIAFFTCSNPFVRLAIADNEIVATSNLGISWVFPINKPEAVFVKKSPVI